MFSLRPLKPLLALAPARAARDLMRIPGMASVSACSLRMGCDDLHPVTVAAYADHLYCRLAKLHGLGRKERLWLLMAALLHDIGHHAGKKGHHKESLRLILADDELPLPPRVRLIVANVARYHRRALPAGDHPHFIQLNPSGRAAVLRLAAILRLADGLDYLHTPVVRQVVVRMEPGRVRLGLASDIPGAVPMMRAEKKADLFRQVFSKTLEISWFQGATVVLPWLP